MNIPLLDLKKQYQHIKNEIEPAVAGCMESGVYIQGGQVTAFEKEISEYLGVKYAITTGNGTDALSIALRAAGIGQGDEVITTPFTFFSTAEVIAAEGAVPVFADIREDTFNIDPACIEAKITAKTKAILPVHIFGQPADMDEICAIAKKHGLIVIEDACQAIGAEYKGKKAGAIGGMGCFSFYPTKNLGCFGDGGMIATNDDRLNVICRALKSHGGGKNGARARKYLDGDKDCGAADETVADEMYNPYKYYNYLIGTNSRLDALQASILRVKLRHLDEWNSKRAQNAEYYNKNLAGADVVLPAEDKNVKHIWHQFALRCKDKNGLISYLSKMGISAGVFYPVPLHLQKAFEYLRYKQGDFPVAEKITSESVCLPVYPELNEDELKYIVECVSKFC